MVGYPRMILVVCLAMALNLVFARQPAHADDKRFTLAVPAELIESGLLKFLLPRFSLKTGVRISIVDESTNAVPNFNTDSQGVPAFVGLGETWFFSASESKTADRFKDWLSSDIGRRTIESFKKGGESVFAAADAKVVEQVAAEPTGDIVLGEKLSQKHCGRCHMVNEETRMSTIGSTPSFALIRALPAWRDRFEGFFALNPHPAFTIIDGVTAERDQTLPIHIQPLKLSLDELDAMTAYIMTIAPKDLGKPLSLK